MYNKYSENAKSCKALVIMYINKIDIIYLLLNNIVFFTKSTKHVVTSENILYYNIHTLRVTLWSQKPHLTSTHLTYKWLQVVTSGHKWSQVVLRG